MRLMQIIHIRMDVCVKMQPGYDNRVQTQRQYNKGKDQITQTPKVIKGPGGLMS